MLTKKQIENYADVMVWGLTTARTGKFKKGDIITVRYYRLATALAEALHARLVERGFNVVMKCFGTDTMDHDFYTLANNKQLTFVGPWEKTYFNSMNGNIFLNAPSSLTHMKDVDPKKMAKSAVARKFAREIMTEREAEGLFGWTLCTFPTEELAKQAGLTLKQYSNQIAKACYLNEPDPVAKWNSLFREAKVVKKWLNKLVDDVKYYWVETANMDIHITPGEKRQWMGVSGHNIPSFEIFTSPDWRGTEGTYYANMPSFRGGNYVEKVTLHFEKGRVKSMSADKGEDYLYETLNMDEGASQIGEFSLTDKRFSKINKFMADTLFDENFGGKQGNCHIAVGASYEDTFNGDPKELTKERKEELGFNDSALHWDLVNSEKKIVTAYLKNGKTKVIYENGMFTY
jgi:aminopeptidase